MRVLLIALLAAISYAQTVFEGCCSLTASVTTYPDALQSECLACNDGYDTTYVKWDDAPGPNGRCALIDENRPIPVCGGDPDSASSHGDPIIHTFKGECYDLNKDGLYLASSHPDWNHDIKVAVYNNFIREFQITSKDDEILFSVNNLNEVTGSWAYGLKHIYRMCTPFNWKECEFSFHEYRFDAQIFMYGVQILFHDYLDPALQKGQRGVHLDIYPRLYEKRQQTFNAEEWDGIYFDNPLPQELAYCPGNSPRRS